MGVTVAVGIRPVDLRTESDKKNAGRKHRERIEQAEMKHS
jgi:hypothetical protein